MVRCFGRAISSPLLRWPAEVTSYDILDIQRKVRHSVFKTVAAKLFRFPIRLIFLFRSYDNQFLTWCCQQFIIKIRYVMQIIIDVLLHLPRVATETEKKKNSHVQTTMIVNSLTIVKKISSLNAFKRHRKNWPIEITNKYFDLLYFYHNGD